MSGESKKKNQVEFPSQAENTRSRVWTAIMRGVGRNIQEETCGRDKNRLVGTNRLRNAAAALASSKPECAKVLNVSRS